MTNPNDATAKALQVIKAIADSIKELGTVPSGTLYATLMTKGISLETHEKILGLLVKANLIRVNNHLITWIG